MSSKTNPATRRFAAMSTLVVSVALLGVVSACTNKSDTKDRPRSEAVTSTSGNTDDSRSNSTEGPSASATGSAEDFACSLISDQQISELAGVSLTGRPRTARISEGTVTFNASECVWEVDGERADTVEPSPGAISDIYLQVSQAGDFRSGKVTCHPIQNSTGTVDGLTAEATWAWNNQNDSGSLAKLRACTDSALITLAVSGGGGEEAVKSFAIGAMRLAIAAA